MQSTKQKEGSSELVRVKIARCDTSTHHGLRVKQQQEHRIYRCKKSISAAYAEHLRQSREEGLRAVAITLTYQYFGEYSSRHLSQVLVKMRAWLKRKGSRLQYVWALERAEALHYHVMIWLPRDLRLEKSQLERWWQHGTTWIEQCKRRSALAVSRRDTMSLLL